MNFSPSSSQLHNSQPFHLSQPLYISRYDLQLLHCVNDSLMAELLLPQLDVICVQVGSFSQSSPPTMSLNGSVCASGWWSDCRQPEILSVLLTSASTVVTIMCQTRGRIFQILHLINSSKEGCFISDGALNT